MIQNIAKMIAKSWVIMSRASLLGLFSSEEAAQCGREHLDCENIIRFEIENPTLDDFGSK